MYASVSSSISSPMVVNICVIISAIVFGGVRVVCGDFAVGGLVFGQFLAIMVGIGWLFLC